MPKTKDIKPAEPTIEELTDGAVAASTGLRWANEEQTMVFLGTDASGLELFVPADEQYEFYKLIIEHKLLIAPYEAVK